MKFKPLSEGNFAFRNKQFEKALDLYRQARHIHPELALIIDTNIKLASLRLDQKLKQQPEVKIHRIDIVVPVYNALNDVKLCLQSLAQHTDGFKVLVLVVNDGSDEATTQWLREFCLSDSLFKLIEHPANRGYSCAVNAGLRATTADYVITQNSDTIVSSGWLTGLVRCMESDPKIGVVGPMPNTATLQNVPKLRDESGGFAVNELPPEKTVDTMAQLVSSVSTRQYPRLPFVNGFCFMIRRSVIDSIGYMDEENFPVEYGEENDFCIRAIDAGYELGIADDVYVFQVKSKSFRHERCKLLSQEDTLSIKRKFETENYSEQIASPNKIEGLDFVRKKISLEINRLEMLDQSIVFNSAKINCLPNRKIVVYTAVSGGYDVLQDPKHVLPNCDYVAFSDRPLDCKVWQIRPFNYFESDIARISRFVKLHPHIYFPNYKTSIWIDANISLTGDPQPFADCLGDDGLMALFPHPHRNCIYVEGHECIKRSKDNSVIIESQLSKYRSRVFPNDAGLWETGVLVRNHLDPKCKQLMAAWWKEIFLGSRRDQISLPVAIHDCGATVRNLAQKGTDLRFHSLLGFKKHSKMGQVPKPTSVIHQNLSLNTLVNNSRKIPVDIGICVYNSPKETKNCICSVINDLGPFDRIIIVNDASGTDTTEMLKSFAASNERIVLINHEVNLGYTRSANEILQASSKPYTILLNSDTVIPRGTISRLVACGESYPMLGIVGPLSNAAGWQSVPALHASTGGFLVNDIPKGITISDMASLCAEASSGVVPFVPLVNGFCFAVKRSVVDSIGYFDEHAFPIGYGEEDDFCLRAADAGFICGVATNAYVYHVKSATFTSERRKILVKAGGAALRSKHTRSRVDKSVEVTQHHPELSRLRNRLKELLESYDPNTTHTNKLNNL
jgi:GT2 family glycosyltransferase